MSKLAELRAKIKKEQENNNSNNSDSNFYPFWEMDANQEAKIRLLPDANEDNEDVYFIKKDTHTIAINGEDKKIPCLKMYDEKCPICELSQDFYKAGDKERGKYYYRNRTNVAQVYVIDDPLPPTDDTNEKREGNICVTTFNWQIMTKMESDLLHNFDDEDDDPWGFGVKRDFIIRSRPVKGQKYNEYNSASQFAYKPSDVEAPEDYEPVDYSQFIPKMISYDKVQAMLEAHLTGTDYEEDDDGNPVEQDESNNDKSVDSFDDGGDDEMPFEADEVDIDDDDDMDEDELLAKIRNRKSS